MKKNKIFLNLTSVFCFIYGAIYCFSLVFIPIGIYCFVAGKLFSKKADNMLDSFSVDKKMMKAYTIFVSIACFPFGLISILAYFGIYGNNVKVEGFQYERVTSVDEPENKTGAEETEQIETEEDATNSAKEETEQEKLEKLEKLKNFRDKNIISEEEFEMAKQQMFGKKEN